MSLPLKIKEKACLCSSLCEKVKKKKIFLTLTLRDCLRYAYISSRLDYDSALFVGSKIIIISLFSSTQWHYTYIEDCTYEPTTGSITSLAARWTDNCLKIIHSVYTALNGVPTEYFADLLILFNAIRYIRLTAIPEVFSWFTLDKNGKI